MAKGWMMRLMCPSIVCCRPRRQKQSLP